MKHLIQKFWITIAMLCLSFSASAYDFKVDGIYYDIIDPLACACGVSGISKSLDFSKEVVIPRQVSFRGQTLDVIKIMDSAFQGTNIVNINLPNTCTSIGQYAFGHCSKLQHINIPERVTSIEDGTFYDCSSLTHINIPDWVTSIGAYAFKECSSLKQITLPKNLTSIASQTFEYCSSLTQINIPDGVTSISIYAFGHCSSLTHINIPDGVTGIGDGAFEGCTSLTKITLPENLNYMGWYTFSGCTSLTEMSVKATTPPFCGELTSSVETYEKCLLKVPVGSLDAYKSDDDWKKFRNIEECDFSGVEAIEGDKALSCVADNGTLRIENKDENSIVRVYNIQGAMVAETSDDVVNNLPEGLYIVTVENKSFKVSLR